MREVAVHIAPTKRPPGESSETGTDDSWALEGFTLKGALSRTVTDGAMPFPEVRIELPPPFNGSDRYDFVLVRGSSDRETPRSRLMHDGIERHFRMKFVFELRPTDVYVLTAPDGQGPGIVDAPASDGFAGFGAMGLEFSLAEPGDQPPTPESFQRRYPTLDALREAIVRGFLGGISIANGTMEEFCQTLEQGLDRLVVDETGLAGRYDIRLTTQGTSTAEFIERLRTELGLVMTPGRREVKLLVAVP